MIDVPKVEPVFTSEVYNRAVIIRRNGESLGYINLHKGDSWRMIIAQLAKKEQEAYQAEQSKQEIK